MGITKVIDNVALTTLITDRIGVAKVSNGDVGFLLDWDSGTSALVLTFEFSELSLPDPLNYDGDWKVGTSPFAAVIPAGTNSRQRLYLDMSNREVGAPTPLTGTTKGPMSGIQWIRVSVANLSSADSTASVWLLHN